MKLGRSFAQTTNVSGTVVLEKTVESPSSVKVKVTLQKISLLFDKVLRNQFHTRSYTSGPSALMVPENDEQKCQLF